MVGLGAPLMAARFPRAYLDLNREPYELDPRMFDGPAAGLRQHPLDAGAGGLGTIPRIVADGQEIYRGRSPSRRPAPDRVALQALSPDAAPAGAPDRPAPSAMPSSSTAIRCPRASVSREDGAKADIVLGDRYGTSCAGVLTDLVDAALRGRGYTVVRNKPYAGGFITEHYGEPALGRHALQIEINRALYMDERTLQKKPGFAVLAGDLIQAFRPGDRGSCRAT